MNNRLTISGSPHVHGGQSIKKIMWTVNIALIPAFLVSLYFFRTDALVLTLFSIGCCLLFQWLIERFLMKRPTEIADGSAVITGTLLAFNLPSNLPLWMVAIGALVSIGIGKMAFGGLGKNPFNPALVGRVFLLISFPADMTLWPVPQPLFQSPVTDALTGPTPLGMLKGALASGVSAEQAVAKLPSYFELLIGARGGSFGEISAIALIIGGLFMLFRKVITWHIPVSFLGSAFIFAAILWLINPTHYVNPSFHLVTGGLILGAVFMATDMVTSPMSNRGQLVFGAGCGILTILIRVFGAYPEGVSFAILIMNALVPLINKGFKPIRFSK